MTCLNVQGGGLLFELSKKAMVTGNTVELDEAIRSKVANSVYKQKLLFTELSRYGRICTMAATENGFTAPTSPAFATEIDPSTNRLFALPHCTEFTDVEVEAVS